MSQTLRDDLWLRKRLDDLALDLGKLRRLTINTMYEYRVERICHEVFTLLAQTEPTAGENVRAGMSVQDALDLRDREVKQMDWMLGLDREPSH